MKVSYELVIGFACDWAETAKAELSYDWWRYTWGRSPEMVQTLATGWEE